MSLRPRPDARLGAHSRIDRISFMDRSPPAVKIRPSERVQRIDEVAARAAMRLRGNPTANRAMYALSSLGDDGRIWIAITVVESVVSPHPVRKFGHAMAWLGIESLIVNKVIKRLVRRARPVPLTEHEHPLRIPRDTSFPSGHAASGATMATILWEGRPRSVAYALLAAAIGFSRVHVGVHHGSDVLAGWTGGVAFGLAARRSVPGASPRLDATVRRGMRCPAVNRDLGGGAAPRS